MMTPREKALAAAEARAAQQVGAGGTLKIIGDAATINVNDDYKLWTGGSQDGALELVLKGGGISTINVTDYMQLRGTLDVSLDPSFVLPTTNTDYDLLVSAKPDRRGTFDTVTLPNETDWSLTYVDGEAGKDIVRLTYVPVPESSTLAITSFTLVGVDTYEVMLEGDALTAYKFDSSSTLVFPGTQVGSLQEGTIPVGTINVAEDEVTTTVDGLATVKMVLTGSANFVRAETAP